MTPQQTCFRHPWEQKHSARGFCVLARKRWGTGSGGQRGPLLLHYHPHSRGELLQPELHLLLALVERSPPPHGLRIRLRGSQGPFSLRGGSCLDGFVGASSAEKNMTELSPEHEVHVM